jgi:hypothetical protein
MTLFETACEITRKHEAEFKKPISPEILFALRLESFIDYCWLHGFTNTAEAIREVFLTEDKS